MSVSTTKESVTGFYSQSYIHSRLADAGLGDASVSSLVRAYIGPSSGDGCALVQSRYSSLCCGRPAKTKPLKIVRVPESNREAAHTALKKWEEQSDKALAERCSDLGSLERDTFCACSEMAADARKMVRKREVTVTIAVDELGTVIHGMCLTTADRAHKARKIEFLITAPHNIRGAVNGEPQVEGVGTALIEDTIVQAIEEHCIFDVAVTLHAIAAAKLFYSKVHFVDHTPEEDDSDVNCILSGSKMMDFMSGYAGRAVSPTPSS